MKKLSLVLILVLSVAILSSCSNSKTIKVGFIADLSSKGSSLGVVGRDSFVNYINRYNENSNDIELEYVIKDDQGNPEITKSLYEEFIDEKVSFIIGPYTSNIAMASSDYLTSGDFLFVSPTVSANVLEGLDDYFFRIIQSSKFQGIALGEMAIQGDKDKPRLAVLEVDSNVAYTGFVIEGFKQTYEPYGHVVYEAQFSSGTTSSYEVLVEELVKMNPTDILIAASGIDVGNIAQLIRLKGSEANIYSGLWANSDDLIRFGGTAVEGLYVTGIFDKTSATKEFEAFSARYQDRYQGDISFVQSTTYDALSLLVDGLENADQQNVEGVKEYIINQRVFTGYNGHIVMDAYGDVVRDMIIFRVENGKFELVN